MKHFAILGYPLGHTLSPQLHRLLAKEMGEEIDYQIQQIPPEQLDGQLDALFSLDGFNITIPYKVRIMDSLDVVDRTAQNHGAVNVVGHLADGRKCGYNTDCIGFVRTMQAHGVTIGGRACVLGAGGVGRMFATECALRGCEVTMAVRSGSMEKAQPVREHILSVAPQAKVQIVDIESLNEGKCAFDLMINATPVGMFPKMDASPVQLAALQEVQTLFDCIYNPKVTKLMQFGEEAGCKVVGGLEMLVWQAAAAQEIWFGRQFTDEQVNRVTEQLQNTL